MTSLPATPAPQAFLGGSDLPGRWAGRRRFVVLEAGFGCGHGFIATWAAWQADAGRCATLHFVAVASRPVEHAALAHAHAASAHPALAAALLQAWPPQVPGLHTLDFAGGRVQLMLALGDADSLLPALRLQADAFHLNADGLDAFDAGAALSLGADLAASEPPPAPWPPRRAKALAALAAPGATLAARSATPGAAAGLRSSLTSAGFAPRPASAAEAQEGLTRADWAPRFALHRPSDPAVAGREAIVLGAGIAGAAAAQALARCGWQVTVLERHAEPATETSGNAAGLFHGTLHADDGRGPYARLFRAAALQAHRSYTEAFAAGVPGAADGLLRLDARAGGLAALQAVLQRTCLPPGYVQALGVEAASALAGLPLAAPAWFYPAGGWVDPVAWVRHALGTPGVRFVGQADVQGLRRDATRWQALDATGAVLATADCVVLAQAASAAALLATLGGAPWPLRHTRGQVTQLTGRTPLRLPVAGDGYAIPLPGGLLCGATREASAPGEATLRHADHLHNLARLQRLTGLLAPENPASWQGRTGWRLHTDDRLPVAGALPLAVLPPGTRLDQARRLPREQGLFVLTALGARGLTLAPLLARLVAAQASGAPWPLEQDLVDAVDPGRWGVRSARHGH